MDLTFDSRKGQNRMDKEGTAIMDRLDAQQFLAGKDISCAVLGSITGGFLLVDLSRPGDKLLTEDEQRDAKQKGFSFCGTLAFVDGACVVASEPDAESASVCAAALPEFSRYVVDRMTPKDGGSGWCDWLKNLWSLPDTREN